MQEGEVGEGGRLERNPKKSFRKCETAMNRPTSPDELTAENIARAKMVHRVRTIKIGHHGYAWRRRIL